MAETHWWQANPTQLERVELEQFFLPHLPIGSHRTALNLSHYEIFNYVLKILYSNCEWEELPVHKDGETRESALHVRWCTSKPRARWLQPQAFMR
jgi:hypothetical protein